MAGGRPTKYRKEFCQDLVDHMSKGGFIETFGPYLADKYNNPKLWISKCRVYDWMEQHEEFRYAKEYGENLSMRYWAQIGHAGMTGQLKRIAEEKFDSQGRVIERKHEPATFGQAAWIFLMKNCFKWRDQRDVQNLGRDGRPADPAMSAPVQVIIGIPDNGRDKK